MDRKEEIINIVCNHAKMENAHQQLHENGDLTQLGINSIDFIKIIVDLEAAFDITVEDEVLNFDNLTTIDLLYEYVENQIQNAK